MKKSDFKLLVEATVERIWGLIGSKGEEYARDDDQLKNFKRSADEAGILPEQVWLIFYNKHIDSIKHYLKTGQKPSEPLESRIDDAILYLLLLEGLLVEKGVIPQMLPAKHPIGEGSKEGGPLPGDSSLGHYNYQHALSNLEVVWWEKDRGMVGVSVDWGNGQKAAWQVPDKLGLGVLAPKHLGSLIIGDKQGRCDNSECWCQP